ncbi:Amidohydrolase family protein [Acidisarcina polymorpha]|uniref:Amidohydrolase family protein n=1 Tax=Acidisarcina polymorpha TaxID=2211140 RepID=A0A2Z5G719_9BACT|nr:amidohydrolase family protein [Acidisarcina polymorpha]AXC14494.1 Amidohydrolase family protein [Acidisarcina polymorpha]
MRQFLLFTALCSVSAVLFAQTPKEQLVKPPADAHHYVIESTGGKHGDSWMWVGADGAYMGRESMNLRGQVWDLESNGKPGPAGAPLSLTIRGVTPQGDAAESFVLANGAASWKSPIDKGSAEDAANRFYLPFGGPMEVTAWFVDTLLATPTHSLKLLPGGEARATRLTTLEVGQATNRRTITLWQVTGFNNTPVPVWTDANNHFFAVAFGIGWLPDAYAGELQHIEQAQTDAMAAQAPVLAKDLTKIPPAAVAFTHVKVFDADGLRFLNDQSVIVNAGKIVAAGAASSVVVPDGAQVIEGKGKTLVPGLWDCHMHVGDDYTGPQELSLGVTSVRDPGNNDKLTIDRRTRAGEGKLLFPHVYPSSLIDGKGPFTAQVANVATSQDEAIALVRKAKENGFTGVKFYGTFNPAWLPATIAEAHKLGLHVHGHIPAGIRTLEAVNDGYDEVTHINWIVMQAVPASVLPTDNGIGRFEAPGRYAKDMDVNDPALTELISTMASKHIYSDPTMVAFEGLYVPDNGDLSPAYAPFVGTLPVMVERNFRSGGFAVPKDLTRADYRASWAKMIQILTKMHQAGIPIIAGTDGSGIEIIHELEIYEQAGFTPAEALASATIVPATLVGQQAHTGSIKVGKTADLALVEGDPEKTIGDLRQTRVVMLDGKLLDADALRQSVGFSGRPKAVPAFK